MGFMELMWPERSLSNLTLVAEVCARPYSPHARAGRDSAETFPNATVASWCEACVRDDGTVSPEANFQSITDANVAAMGLFDNAAFVTAVFIITFTLVGELKDIQLCSIAIAHAGGKVSLGWRLALGFILWIRRWIFVQGTLVTVSGLVTRQGGDAISV